MKIGNKFVTLQSNRCFNYLLNDSLLLVHLDREVRMPFLFPIIPQFITLKLI
nr:MAG TPA: hypothetical protein [Caudoviricetes sp.]